MIKRLLVIFSLLLTGLSADNPKKIALCVVATGSYDRLAQGLIESSRLHFCKNHQVTYFVFTDGQIESREDVVCVRQEKMGWPLDTLKRFHVYLAHEELLKEMDYIFAADADMRFVAPVNDEVLGSLVGVQHPVFIGKRGDHEKNEKSSAYVSKEEGKTYFSGKFYGGSKEEFLKLLRTVVKRVDLDLKKGIVAKWHDVSHLNRYFVDHPPLVILSPSYCYPENWKMPYAKKLVALDRPRQDNQR